MDTVVLEAFQRKEFWGHQIMRDSCLAVGVNRDKNKERTKARQARRKDLHKFCSNIKKHDSQPYERGLRDVIVVLLAVQ